MRYPVPPHAPAVLVGARASIGPLQDIALPLRGGEAGRTGVTAMYGLNGAGKTWLLTAIRRALGGRVPEREELGGAHVLVDLPPESAAYAWVQEQLVGEGWNGRGSSRGYGPWQEVREFELRQIEKSIREALLRGGLRQYFSGSLLAVHQNLIEELAAELAHSCSFALVPTGRESRTWHVWICAPADPAAHPVARGVLADLRGTVEQYRRGHDGLYRLQDGDQMTPEQVALDGFASQLESHPVTAWIRHYETRPIEETGNDHVGPWSRMWSFVDDDLPVPLVPLFEARDDVPLAVLDDIDSPDVDHLTTVAFAAQFARAFEDEDAVSATQSADALPSVALTAEMLGWVRQVERDVNETYGWLLLDAPPLSLMLQPPSRWLTQSALAWRAGEVPVQKLSAAESRWATLAVRHVLRRRAGHLDAVIIDEPEAALHRAAEEHMATGLERLAVMGCAVVVATHSPMVLDNRATDLVEVRKTEGRTTIAPLDTLTRESLDRLGLRPSDLLRRTRVFVLTEGEHDEIIINALCRDAIKDAHAVVLPMHGGSNLQWTVDSRILHDFTDASVVAVLDNLRSEQVEMVWETAKVKRREVSLAAAKDYVVESLPGKKSSENTFLRVWLTAILEREDYHRFVPFGLKAKDIVLYLPVEEIVPRARGSWEEILAEKAAANPDQEIKKWLKGRYQARFEEPDIRRAVEAIPTEQVPTEFVGLSALIRRLGREPR